MRLRSLVIAVIAIPLVLFLWVGAPFRDEPQTLELSGYPGPNEDDHEQN